MKTIKTHINRDNHPQDFTVFEFPSEEDKKAFFEVVGDDITVIKHHAQGRDWFQPWRAWERFRDAGWIHDRNDEQGFLIWCMPETDEERLELALKKHDWYFEYSDDHRVWVSGNHELARIRTLMGKVGEPRAKELWEQYCPKNDK